MSLTKRQSLQTSVHVDCVALFERHIGFFHVFTLAELAAETLHFTFGDRRVDRFHLHTKERFNRFFDLGLVGVDMHFKNNSTVL